MQCGCLHTRNNFEILTQKVLSKKTEEQQNKHQHNSDF